MSKPRIGVIVSTVRPNRIGPKVARWVLEAAPHAVTAEIVDLAEAELPFFRDLEMPRNGNYDTHPTQAWAQTIANFDGFIVALAEYNAAYPAPLKNAIDALSPEWNRKPFGIVSYGWHGGNRAATALKPILTNVGLIGFEPVMLTFNRELGVDGELLDAPTAALANLWEHVIRTAPTK